MKYTPIKGKKGKSSLFYLVERDNNIRGQDRTGCDVLTLRQKKPIQTVLLPEEGICDHYSLCGIKN